ARGRGELLAPGSARLARLLALLDRGFREDPVLTARERRRAAPRVGDRVESARFRFTLGIRGPAGAPGATSGEAVSQRGEGHAPDGVPGGGVAGGGEIGRASCRGRAEGCVGGAVVKE